MHSVSSNVPLQCVFVSGMCVHATFCFLPTSCQVVNACSCDSHQLVHCKAHLQVACNAEQAEFTHSLYCIHLWALSHSKMWSVYLQGQLIALFTSDAQVIAQATAVLPLIAFAMVRQPPPFCIHEAKLCEENLNPFAGCLMD